MGHGLFRRHEYDDNRRRFGLCAGVGAESVGPGAEEDGGGNEAGAGQSGASGEGRLPDIEIGYARIAWPARDNRSTGAADDSRYLAKSQGAVAARGVSGDSAR